jgi:hypothetical protein
MNRADKQIESMVKRWLDTNLALVEVKRPISNHIDEIIHAKELISDVVNVSVQAYLSLVELLRQLQTPVKPMLIIPLHSTSRTITQAVPTTLSEVRAQLDLEPPSLYLVDWDIGKAGALCEEFNTPLPFELIDRSFENIYLSYIEIRCTGYLENNWEFRREIRAEYFPLGVIRD